MTVRHRVVLIDDHTLVRAGLVVLAQDPVGQGERLSYYDPETKKTFVPPTVIELIV